ncbi:hypothetical protein LX36DRAFT_665098 [Colletotrichum falcatum]|nr:hypothetical protein LX36DRAFT_665098 [Colletotrichum falcatum]
MRDLNAIICLKVSSVRKHLLKHSPTSIQDNIQRVKSALQVSSITQFHINQRNTELTRKAKED